MLRTAITLKSWVEIHQAVVESHLWNMLMSFLLRCYLRPKKAPKKRRDCYKTFRFFYNNVHKRNTSTNKARGKGDILNVCYL